MNYSGAGSDALVILHHRVPFSCL